MRSAGIATEVCRATIATEVSPASKCVAARGSRTSASKPAAMTATTTTKAASVSATTTVLRERGRGGSQQS
jgi:hypothetical protein